MVGRKKGSKNKSVVSAAINDPYVYGALRILEQARIDYGTKYRRDGEKSMGNNCPDSMWAQWIETETYKQKEAGELTIDCGIASYIA